MSSYKDLQPKTIKETPFTNIGCHDLCSIEVNLKGHLRKEGQLERGLKRLGPLSKVANVQWRQYFVVLSQGHLYIFSDEHSSTPKTHLSLLHYKKLQRNFAIPFSFEVIPSAEDGKVYKFSCVTDTERLEWMRALYVSLLAVHKLPIPEDVQHKKKCEEYIVVESEIGLEKPSDGSLYEIDDDESSEDERYDKPDEIIKIKNKYTEDPTFTKRNSEDEVKPKLSTKSQRSMSEIDYSYTDGATEPIQSARSNSEGDVKINEICKNTTTATTKLKPQVAPKPGKHMYINSSDRSNSKRVTSPLRSPEHNALSDLPDNSQIKELQDDKNVSSLKVSSKKSQKPSGKPSKMYSNVGESQYVLPDTPLDPDSEYMFDGDKSDTARVLDTTEERTFLIRNSSEPGKKVLVVQTNMGLKSFKIEKLGNKLMIEAGVSFDSYHEFVEHYKRHKLPNINIQLKLGYNKKFHHRKEDDDDYEPVEEPIKNK